MESTRLEKSTQKILKIKVRNMHWKDKRRQTNSASIWNICTSLQLWSWLSRNEKGVLWCLLKAQLHFFSTILIFIYEKESFICIRKGEWNISNTTLDGIKALQHTSQSSNVICSPYLICLFYLYTEGKAMLLSKVFHTAVWCNVYWSKQQVLLSYLWETKRGYGLNYKLAIFFQHRSPFCIKS